MPNGATFAAQGSELDAQAEYLKIFHGVTPCGLADLTSASDTPHQEHGRTH